MTGNKNNRKITVRQAEISDSPEIARLNFLFNQVENPPQFYEVRLSDPHRTDFPILAQVDAQIVGLANLRILQPVLYSQPYAELTELFVDPDFRRIGVASALIDYVEIIAVQAGAEEIILLTDFYNDAALKFYHARGYLHHDIALSKSLRSRLDS